MVLWELSHLQAGQEGIARTDVQPAQLLKRGEQGMPPSALYDGQLQRL